MPLVISLRPRKAALVLAFIAVCLAALSLAARFLVEATAAAPNLFTNLVQVVNVNRESSIPAWYSSALLLLAAVLLGISAATRRGERYARHWAGLAAVFVYLSIDEAAAIHEEFTEPLQTAFNTSGYMTFAWVIVGAIFVLGMALVYGRFVLHLPPKTRRGFIAAGVLYVGGALVIEAVSANQWYQDDGSSLLYSVIGTVEELCEMLGVIVLIYTLLSYLEQRQVAVQVQITSAPAPPQAALREHRLKLAIALVGGVNFGLIQWLVAREAGALLGAELAALLVMAASSAGLLLGYVLAGRVRRGTRLALGAVALALHLTLPVWLRLLVTLGAGMIYPGLSLLAALIAPVFYSLLLPPLADAGAARLPILYAAALAGAVVGTLAFFLLGSAGLAALLLVYSAGLIVILLALRLHPIHAALLALAAGAWLIVFPAADTWSSTRWYQQLAGLPAGTHTLHTAYSRYQKVDVLEAPDGNRYLYLDGLNDFGAPDGQRLNYMMSLIPGRLLRPPTALIIGAAAMPVETTLAEFARQMTTVEVDSQVIAVRARYFDRPTLSDHQMVLDEPQRYLAAAAERYDLAVATGRPTLSAEPLLKAIKSRLTPGGALVLKLPGVFEADNSSARRLAAGLLLHFDDVFIITPEGAAWSIAYAGDALPFDRHELETALRDIGETAVTIYETPAVRAITGAALPITPDLFDRLLVSLDGLTTRWAGR